MSPSGVMGILGAVCLRVWLKTLRRPVVLVFSLVQPLMWLFFFGFLFHRFPLEDLPDGMAYFDFLLPGVCVMTVLFGASQAGTGFIKDMQGGFLARMAATPAPAAALLGGKVLADVVRVLAQAAVVCLLGIALGARLHPDAGPLVLALGQLALFAFAYASLSCWLALATRSQETMGVFIQAVNMPLLFTSTVLVPARQMPEWLAGLARWNPLSPVVEGLRAALLGADAGPRGMAISALALGALGAFVGGLKAAGSHRRM